MAVKGILGRGLGGGGGGGGSAIQRNLWIKECVVS